MRRRLLLVFIRTRAARGGVYSCDADISYQGMVDLIKADADKAIDDLV